MKHIILPTGLHAITEKSGRVHIFTEREYTHLSGGESKNEAT